jgi:uncharacterized protein with PIN domain
MVIYMDTSAWLKVDVSEKGHDLVGAAIASAKLVATSTIAYAEVRAGLARRMREGEFTSHEYADIIDGLGKDWITFARVPVLDHVAYRAGEWAHRLNLLTQAVD